MNFGGDILKRAVEKIVKYITEDENNNIYVIKSCNLKYLEELYKNISNALGIFILYPYEEIVSLTDIKTYTEQNISQLFIQTNKKIILTYEQLMVISIQIKLEILNKKFIIFEDNFYTDFMYPFDQTYIIKKIKAHKEDQEITSINEFYTFEIKNTLNGQQIVCRYNDEGLLVDVDHEIIPLYEPHLDNGHVAIEVYKEVSTTEVVYAYQVEELDIKNDNLFVRYEERELFDFIEKNLVQTISLVIPKKYIDKFLQQVNIWRQEYEKVSFVLFYVEEHKKKKDYSFDQYLKLYWKSSEFRKYNIYDLKDQNKITKISQAEILQDIMTQIELAQDGKEDFQDLFFVGSTGSGKSLLYQLPAIIEEQQKKMVIVISPLIALMKDQVANLNNDLGVSFAAYINSDLSYAERLQIYEGIKEKKYSLIYLSPEFLQGEYQFTQLIDDREIALMVIDEAHCVSTWGKDFRVDYAYLGEYIEKIRKNGAKSSRSFPILALTATAVYGGELDTIDEIVKLLHFKNNNPILYYCNVKRNDIEIDIKKSNINGDYNVEKEKETLEQIQLLIRNNKKSIVYVLWKSHGERLYQFLPQSLKSKVALYTADTTVEEKNRALQAFKTGTITMIIATKAFGMGVDIDNIEVVYHHTLSGSVCDYVQEVGRAARGKEISGKALSYYYPKDFQFYKKLKGMSRPSNYELSSILSKIQQEYIKHRNTEKKVTDIMVPLEAFSFALKDDDKSRLEMKIRQSLFLIQQDLRVKAKGRDVIQVYPKEEFGMYYCMVLDQDFVLFCSKYKDYIKETYTIEENTRYSKTLTSRDKMNVINDRGKIIAFDLVKYWKKERRELSFKRIKALFFNGSLFLSDGIESCPRTKCRINLVHGYGETKEQLEEVCSIFEEILLNIQAKKAYIGRKEIDEIIFKICKEHNELVKDDLLKKVKNIFYSILTRDSDVGIKVSYKVLLQRKDYNEHENTIKYSVSGIIKQIYRILQVFEDRFQETTIYEKFLVPPYGNDDSYTIQTMDIAHLLEGMGLANYELNGGKMPCINIIVRLPNMLSIRSYKNEELIKLKDRDNKELKVMEQIIYATSSDERWRIIEDYFLGRIEL